MHSAGDSVEVRRRRRALRRDSNSETCDAAQRVLLVLWGKRGRGEGEDGQLSIAEYEIEAGGKCTRGRAGSNEIGIIGKCALQVAIYHGWPVAEGRKTDKMTVGPGPWGLGV
ncbi:hypothetical protein GALMADRAFT_252696 [Galerina marginata CBS 339.88]|uniref:Uncharacterized protein n=1 Tax=Galerina marginata (strain CBS 339.88) TaxID=685588 RepID=A0A067T0M3_GALM3|nr:hypothetical protein GALMADRAFT_252696 [Galerina marginata CBS 339.88]